LQYNTQKSEGGGQIVRRLCAFKQQNPEKFVIKIGQIYLYGLATQKDLC